MPGPFGPKPLIYADYVASGRSLDFIENAMVKYALPCYGNTHTETSYTGRETTRLREMARAEVKNAVGASDKHAAIFTGSGATAAVDKLVRAMGLYAPEALRRAPSLRPRSETPVVFVGPYEHHSNDLPWREAMVDVERIPLNDEGQICLETLREALSRFEDRSVKIGAFSAASNVTGVKTDVRALATLLHEHNALFFCDFAAGGPYMTIDISESRPGANDHIDAIFLSPHKFIGGPGASGLLVADRKLLSSKVPSVAGGGTVSYVTGDHQAYVRDEERREEAGTPGILGDIRTGMALRLKSDVGAQRIEELEQAMVKKAIAAWSLEPAINLLGSKSADRVGIFSFNISHGDKDLHHGFVVALLNDLFGIQARGGCSCAGPYAHDLLKICPADAERHENLVQQGSSLMRPGWVRLGFNYFFDEETVDYIIEAVSFIARNGAAFLPFYQVNPENGVWSAITPLPQTPSDLPDFSAVWRGDAPAPAIQTNTPTLKKCMETALELARNPAQAGLNGQAGTGPNHSPLSAEAEAMRWFWMPNEREVTKKERL